MQVELLQDSFNLNADQKSEFAASFYHHLFNDFPEVAPLFAKTDIQEQGKKLMNSLTLVVENLKNPVKIAAACQALGHSHQGFNVRPEHFAMVGTTLIKVFGEFLGDKWTPELKQAWLEAYNAVADGMLASYGMIHPSRN